MVPLVREAFKGGSRVRMQANGQSMRPFIRNGEVVELESPGAGVPRRGAVVLVDCGGDHYVLHRVSRLTASGFYTRGDAHRHEEGPFEARQVVARAVGVVRGARTLPVDSGVRGALARAWAVKGIGGRSWVLYRALRSRAGRVLRAVGVLSA
jgi:hypothetical protein